MARPAGSRNRRSEALQRACVQQYGRDAAEQLQQLVMVDRLELEETGGDPVAAMGARARRIAKAFGLENAQAAKLLLDGLQALLPYHHAKRVAVHHSQEAVMTVSLEAPAGPAGPAIDQARPVRVLTVQGMAADVNEINELADGQILLSHGPGRMEGASR